MVPTALTSNKQRHSEQSSSHRRKELRYRWRGNARGRLWLGTINTEIHSSRKLWQTLITRIYKTDLFWARGYDWFNMTCKGLLSSQLHIMSVFKWVVFFSDLSALQFLMMRMQPKRFGIQTLPFLKVKSLWSAAQLRWQPDWLVLIIDQY